MPNIACVSFYRAMLRRARLCHVKLSVCLCLSVTFGYADHTDWNDSKIISRMKMLKILKVLARADPNIGDLVQREQQKIPVKYGSFSYQKSCNISETRRDRTTVTITV